MGSLFSGVFGGWLLRKLMEGGGVVATIITSGMALWALIPEPGQALIMRILAREWSSITLLDLWVAVPPAAIAIWGYVWSYKKTLTPSATTKVDGKLVQVKEKDIAPSTVEAVKTSAGAAVSNRPRSIIDRLFGR